MKAADLSALETSLEQHDKAITATSERIGHLEARLLEAAPDDKQYLQQLLLEETQLLRAQTQLQGTLEAQRLELYKERSQLRKESAEQHRKRVYKDISVQIIGLEHTSDADNVRVHSKWFSWQQTTADGVQRYLRQHGCVAVLPPDAPRAEHGWIDIALIELKDGMVLTAAQASIPLEAQLATLNGFVATMGRSLEEAATAKVCTIMKETHDTAAEVLPIKRLASKQHRKKGKKQYREVDGLVSTPDCIAIVEVKNVLDPDAVTQLTSCMDFVATQPLAGDAAVLKGKQLQGFLAGRTITTDPNQRSKLIEEAWQRGYPILLPNGEAFSSGRGAVPKIPVKCAARVPKVPVKRAARVPKSTGHLH